MVEKVILINAKTVILTLTNSRNFVSLTATKRNRRMAMRRNIISKPVVNKRNERHDEGGELGESPRSVTDHVPFLLGRTGGLYGKNVKNRTDLVDRYRDSTRRGQR